MLYSCTRTATVGVKGLSSRPRPAGCPFVCPIVRRFISLQHRSSDA